MQKAIAEQIDQLIEEGSEISSSWEINRWSQKVAMFLRTTLGEDLSREFSAIESPNEWDVLSMRLGLLQGIVAKARGGAERSDGPKQGIDAVQQSLSKQGRSS